MAVQIIRAGQSVRVQVRARSIVDTYVSAGYLYVVYSDGTTDFAGYVGGGGGVLPPIPDLDNTYANSETVYANAFPAELLAIQNQLDALGA